MFLDSRYKNYRIGELPSVEALSFFFHALVPLDFDE